MTLEYPQPLAAPYGPFAPIVDVVRPDDADQKAYRARPSIPAVLGIGDEDTPPLALRVRRSDHVGVTRLYLTAGPLTSTSAHNGDRTDKPAVIDAFWFCPGADTPTLSWKMRHPDDIDHAIVTVRAARIDTPISIVRIDAGRLVGGAAVPGCTGGCSLDAALDLAGGPHAAIFPNGVLTVEHSPYRVELTIVKQVGCDREAYPTTAWTFTHVLVHAITLERGAIGQIPAGPPPGVDAALTVRGERAERDLVRAFLGAGTPLTQDAVIELVAPVHEGSYADPAHALDPSPTEVHAGVKALWGEGPRIPLRAQVAVRKADGSASTAQHSGIALGKIKLMWDWRDDPARVDAWLQGNRGEYSHISRSYIDSMIAAPTVGPRGSANCPAQYGGRRGATTPVFQACAAGLAGTNAVGPASIGRHWAAISEMSTGRAAHTSSVLFTPGIVSGDEYKIAVYLTSADEYADFNNDDKPVLHIDDPDDERLSDAIAALAQNVRPPLAETGTFSLARRTNALILEDNAGVNAVAQAATQQMYLTFAGLTLDIATQAIRADVWQNDHTGAAFTWEQVMGKTQAQCGSLVPLLAFVRPMPAIGPHLIAVRSLEQVLDLIGQRLREGGGHVVEAADRSVGEFHKFGATETYLLAPFTPTVNPTGAVHHALLVERGALPPTGTQSDMDITYRLGRARRLCFGAEQWVDAFAATNPESRVTITFAAAGLVEAATLNYAGRLHVAREPPDDAAATVGGAIDRLVAALHGPVFESPLTITVTARHENGRDTARVDRAKQVVRTALRERVENLDVEAVIAALMAAPYGRALFNQPPPLDTEVYWTAMKAGVKTMTTELIERIRGLEMPNQEGLVYLDITNQAAEGVFPAGGNMLINFPGEQPPKIWTTLFKGAGFQMLQTASTTDYALQAFCSAEDTMIHEFGHAYWRPHAPRAVWGFSRFADKAADHVPHDTCLMNYDVDPGRYFCGRCVLALRGWNNLPPTDPAVPTVAEAIALLQADIDAETDATREAWKQLRMAYLVEKSGRPADATNEIGNALGILGQRDGSGEHMAFRRAVIRGYLANGNGWAIDHLARPLWRELLAFRPRFADLWDMDQPATPFFAAAPWKVELIDGYRVAQGPATQYVNLPRERRFVDGDRVTSVDRLGSRVRCKISFTTPGNYAVEYRLVGHAADPLVPAGPLEPGFASLDGNYTVAVGPVRTVNFAAARAAVVDIDLAALVRPGVRLRLLARDPASGECIESPELRVRQLLFYLKLTSAGAAQTQVFTDDAAFTAALDAAYVAAGVDFVHLGSRNLLQTDFHYDANKTKLEQSMLEIDGASAAACAHPFTPLAPSYADYRPHLYVFTFVDTVIQRMGRRPHTVAVNGHDPAQPFPILLRGIGAEFVGGVLWDGRAPTNLADERVRNNVPGHYTERYTGHGVAGSEWLVSASFARGGGNWQAPLYPGELTAAVGNPNLPGRLNQIDVDLRRFVQGNGTVTGTLRVDFLWAIFQGGVSVKDDSAHRNVAVISTRASYAVAAYDDATQHAAAIHEIGHALGMVPDVQTTHFNIHGSGPHCWTGLPQPQPNELNDDQFYAARLDQAACVMFYRLRPGNPMVDFCPTCTASLRALDLSPGFR